MGSDEEFEVVSVTDPAPVYFRQGKMIVGGMGVEITEKGKVTGIHRVTKKILSIHRAYHFTRSKYMPHQGEGERARRLGYV